MTLWHFSYCCYFAGNISNLKYICAQQQPIFNTKFVAEGSWVLADRWTHIGTMLCFEVLPRNRTLCQGAKGGVGGKGKRNPEVKGWKLWHQLLGQSSDIFVECDGISRNLQNRTGRIKWINYCSTTTKGSVQKKKNIMTLALRRGGVWPESQL